MERTCKKCGKTLVAKRKTKQYCNATCRSVHGQQVRRGAAVANPLTTTELFLLNIVLSMGALAGSVWTELHADGEKPSVTNIEKLSYYGTITQDKLIQELQVRHGLQLAPVIKRLTLGDDEVP